MPAAQPLDADALLSMLLRAARGQAIHAKLKIFVEHLRAETASGYASSVHHGGTSLDDPTLDVEAVAAAAYQAQVPDDQISESQQLQIFETSANLSSESDQAGYLDDFISYGEQEMDVLCDTFVTRQVELYGVNPANLVKPGGMGRSSRLSLLRRQRHQRIAALVQHA